MEKKKIRVANCIVQQLESVANVKRQWDGYNARGENVYWFYKSIFFLTDKNQLFSTKKKNGKIHDVTTKQLL